MNQHSNPLDYIIRCCEQGLIPQPFDISNAKDELQKLRQDSIELNEMLQKPVAFGKINERFDLYDLRIVNNPYYDQTKIVPLYSNRKEFLDKDWKGYDVYAKHFK